MGVIAIRTSGARRMAMVALGISALALGCGSSGPPPALRVGGVAYTADELAGLSERHIEELIDLTAFGLAVARGELERVGAPYIERERQRLLLQRLTAEVSVREAGLDDDALRQRYAQDPELELVVRHLVIISERWRNEEHRAQARARAEAALRRIRAGEDFVRVASEVSEEPGAAERGGLLSPGRKGTWVPEFWEAALALRPGQISDVVETEYGFHVLRLEERRPIPFEEVRSEVIGRLIDLATAAERAEQWANREAQNVTIYADAIIAWRAGAAPDTTALATWPGGAYRGADLRRYLITLDDEARSRVEFATDEAFTGVVRGLARNAYLASRAAEMGIAISEDEAAAGARRWVGRVEAWADVLGFRRGVSVDELKAAARAALAATQQEKRIARANVASISRALRAVYDIERAEPQTAAGAPRPGARSER